MLRSINEFNGYPLQCSDGKIGHVKDCLFDEREWKLRYLVAELGKPFKHQVLIQTEHLDRPEVGWTGKKFDINLTKEEVESSPPVNSEETVSQKVEKKITVHYGRIQPYFENPSFDDLVTDDRLREIADCRLRSADKIRQTEVEARDGHIGTIDDLIIDTTTWQLRYFVVKTRDFLPGGKVIIPILWLNNVHHFDRLVEVDLSVEEVKHSPTYNPHEAINREYEGVLYDYYGRPTDWVNTEPKGI